MFDIGRVCVKIAGRDSRKKACVVEILENNYVLIDGETRRRKCNTMHLEPLDTVLEIKEKATTEEVLKAFKDVLGIEVKITKPKKSKERPKKVRHIKAEAEVPKTATKKATKKATAKKTTKKKVTKK